MLFIKQKTAYEMRISDWSSDVCSSDLGNEAYLVRRAMISTANMASFGSLHGFALGQAAGNHWGDAVALLETTSATPFFFNFHHGDLGNFSVQIGRAS